jgi:putative transposase
MPQSLVKNYIHITFCTKNRYPFIDDEIKAELFSYLGGICKNLECNPIIVGGYREHVHILCLLSRKIALMKLVEELKSHSSKWIKTKGKQYQNFYWQNGYGGFSIHYSRIEVVKNYIFTQEEHHRKLSFQDEYRTLLKKSDINFDERYVWD